MQRSIKSNYFYNSVYQVLIIILPLLTAPFLSRIMGPEKIGVYSYSYSISYYFMMIAMLGINNYGNRSCSIVRENKVELSKTFFGIYYCQLITGILCCLAYVVWIQFLPGKMRMISLIMLLNVLSAVFDINWFYFGIEEFKLTTTRNIIIKLATVFLTFAIIRTEQDLWKYTLIMSSGIILSQLSMWPFLKKHIIFTKIGMKDVIKHVKPILILFIPVVAVSLYKVMDKIMLGMMSTMTETGYYENTEKLINMPLGLINALGVVMLPRMSNLAAKKDKKESLVLISNSMLFVSFLSIAMAFGLASIAPEFVPLFFGESFTPCIELVIFIAPTMIFFSFANVIRTQYLIPNKKDKSYIISVFAGALINLTVNYFLIPKMNAMGAVIGTLFAEATVCILQMWFVRKNLVVYKYLFQAIPFIISGVVMSFSVRLVALANIQIFLKLIMEIGVGVLVYSIFVVSYLYVFKRELLQKILKRKS